MQITERGQVTIPLKLREQFGFLPHTEVEFSVQNGQLVLRKKTEASRNRLSGIYGKKRFERSTDDLMKLLRDE
ncbi:AbrB/MazE/SpoVT family DNA-binding domain-containing protein [Candidatus Thiothrix sp. Deng01]|uniref:AbrB/MazE/SpoVT family DNA-binding domain-containing protein n=1 Tax=Candidatus Thiothrix phosphatis TaxID=3112415 RepID=A0ABU6CYG9_9GAMM|nr:AbrB/MazE/SpoVT family DNA-binding domain-containing protein [Candidatus Thiothrix sp. Deng01]MEB4591839.1 AbrB/MazE/SpoVT family DNA-binding domain-containing protein [Candidatus Thiothrix sp. Deng01]